MTSKRSFFTALLLLAITIAGCGKIREVWKSDAGRTGRFQSNVLYVPEHGLIVYWAVTLEEDEQAEKRYVIPRVAGRGGIRMELTQTITRSRLRAVDVFTGDERWSSSFLGKTEHNLASPVLYGSSIFVANEDGELFELSAQTGEVLNVLTIGREEWITADPIVTPHYIVLYTQEGTLWCFDKETHSLLWKNNVGHTQNSWIIHQNMILGFTGNTIQGFSLHNGAEIYRYELQDKYIDIDGLEKRGPEIMSHPVLADGIIYFSARSHFLYALDFNTQHLLWKAPLGAASYSTPFVYGDSVFIGTAHKTVLRIGLERGELKRTFRTDHRWVDMALRFRRGGIVNCTPVVNNNIVYFGAHDFTFYAYNINSGRRRWKYFVKNRIDRITPLVVHDMIVFGADTHHVYALPL